MEKDERAASPIEPRRSRGLMAGEYNAWTKRGFGVDLVATYAGHSALTLSNAAQ